MDAGLRKAIELFRAIYGDRSWGHDLGNCAPRQECCFLCQCEKLLAPHNARVEVRTPDADGPVVKTCDMTYRSEVGVVITREGMVLVDLEEIRPPCVIRICGAKPC